MTKFTIERMNLDARYMLLNNDEIVPLDKLLDSDGDETEDPDEAVSVVAGPDARGQWWAINIQNANLNMGHM